MPAKKRSKKQLFFPWTICKEHAWAIRGWCPDIFSDAFLNFKAIGLLSHFKLLLNFYLQINYTQVIGIHCVHLRFVASLLHRQELLDNRRESLVGMHCCRVGSSVLENAIDAVNV